jgi:minor extracellular serine protease Vpr
MRKTFAILALWSLVLAPMATAEQLHPLPPVPAADSEAAFEEVVSAWFVELRGTPLADGGSPASLAAEKQAFRAAAAQAGVSFRERHSYDTLWNGFSVEVGASGVAKLSRLPQVKSLYPVIEMSLPEPGDTGPGQDLSTALAMTQADIAQNDLGLTGQGIRVAIMDSGIDVDHPDLGGCFGPGCRVEIGWDFVGDAYNNDSSSPSYNPVPSPDPIPDDCGGHGTHVAGIVGANGVVRGVAPGVTFGAYRVFGCSGSTSADIMVAAMERIFSDGAHVLNMSIGSAFQWPQYPTAAAADRLVNRGVVVVASAGNNGSSGLYASGAPGVGRKVISVANFLNTHVKYQAFAVSPDGTLMGYSPGSGAPLTPLSGTEPLARTGTQASTIDACNPVAPAPGSLTGHVALIRRGGCGFHEKVVNAQNAGATGVVIYNNGAGRVTPNVTGPAQILIPVVSITAADGELIDDRLAGGPVDLTWTTQTVQEPIANGGLISASSSYGLNPELDIKPDVGAPGGQIRSTFPLEQGAYGNLSGTSMSSPHVAGSVALLLEARPNTPPAAVRSLLQNSAVPVVWWGSPGLGFLDNVHRQGAGMVQIADAVRSTLRVEPGKLALGESEAGPAVRTLTLENDGPAPVTLDLSHTPALSTGPNTFAPTFHTGFASVAFSAPSVTVPAGGTASVDVTIAANAGLADHSLYGGYLELTPQGGGTTVRVPYAGFKGDYQSKQVLAPTANGFPWLAIRSGGSYFNRPDGATYSLVGLDIPFFLVHLDHQTRELKMEIFDADTGKAWHQAFSFDYVGRNSGATSFFALAWDGVTTNGNKVNVVPDGRYVAKLTARKALGDSGNPAHQELWTSPVITIDRP